VAARRRSGFSLVELLVALACAGILLGGMVRVCLASLDSWTRVNQTLAAQRSLRWALDRIAEDVRLMGHRFPPVGAPGPDAADPARPGGYLLVPGRPVGAALPGGPDGEPRTPDEISFVLDLPVPVRAALAQAAPAGAAAVRVRADRALRLRPGDRLLAPGERFEWAAVARAARLPAGKPGTVHLASAWTTCHPAGTPVQGIRPQRAVRYAVVALPPDPGSAMAGPVPCLVRFEADCPRDGSWPRWDRMPGPSGRQGSGCEVVARHVAAFQVDLGSEGLVRVHLETRCPTVQGNPRRGATLVLAPRNLELR
jgi:prepilin-type N-terminal cleavage/methylation domain-containing protein